VFKSLSEKITIIIPTWNCLEYTKNCLASLKKNTDYPDYEVLLVDNGSTDGTIQYLEGLDWVKLIKNSENLGFVRANNIAIRQTKGDILLLNNDVLITDPKWLTAIHRTAYEDDNIGIVGCRLVNGDGHLLHAGTYMPVPEYWGEQIGSGEKNINQYSSKREVEGVVGACMYIKRALIDKIGILDEDYFSYFEDTDYCLKAREAGFHVMYEGSAQLTHFENTSTKLNKADFSDMFLESQKIFISKWEKHFKERFEAEVMWHSIVAINIGYAVTSRNLVLALDEQNVDVRYGFVYGVVEAPSPHPKLNSIRRRPKSISIPQVIYGQGDVFYKNSGKYKIGYTMLEVSGIPGHWVDQANMMDEVWVPSHFNMRTFRESGVKRPIKVMPLGIDPNYFNPNIKSFYQHDKYVFLSVFEWGERKAPEVLINAFNQEFKKNDDVLLIVKILNFDPAIDVAREIAKLNLAKQKRAKIVVLLNTSILDYQMGSLYRSADCFVLPTRGEGWGMPILEAMACGLPVITTDWSAQTEFINPDICYPLQVKELIPAKAKCPYYEGFKWADPDIEHLRRLMRYVYEHQEEAGEKGKLAAAAAASKWTWNAAAKRIKKRLIEVSE